jgi:hypothetical protein
MQVNNIIKALAFLVTFDKIKGLKSVCWIQAPGTV